ncbi:hypothetical protein FMEXI_8564 [Fusarium mexicanum]|uniref:Calcium permeable stress-gated cation channel 1 n=1 Tax=Fusarium mexicanum TaxID=751941 RepID=A0A8H5IQT3_9HYPO|nr:hypothetical protein FMEXI_8564 [Fusarium mexicanum]
MAPPSPIFTPNNGKWLGPGEFSASLDDYVNSNANVFEEHHSSLCYTNSPSFFDNAVCSYDDSSITQEDCFGARIVHHTENDIDSEDRSPSCHVEEDSNLDGPESSNTNPTHPVGLFDPLALVGSTIDPKIHSSDGSVGPETHIKPDATEGLLLQRESTSADSKTMQDQIKADFDEEMLQDAMAILKLQNLTVSSKQDQACLNKDISTMMDKWATQKLADSLSALEDQSTVGGIYKLHQLLLSLIKDYLNKATSDFLPRAYRGFPVADSDLTYTEHPRLEGRFNLDHLDKSGRNLLFWAFLRHELMSKVRLYIAIIDRSYRPPVELSRRGGHKFLPWEDEAIRCVHTYIQTLYTAFFSEWSGVAVPDQPPLGLGRSSSIVCETTQWVEALTYDKSVCATVAARLPNYGLQPIMSLMDERQKQQGPVASIEPALSLLRDARCGCDYGRAHRETISGNFDRKKGLVPELWMGIVLRHGTPRNYTQENLTLLRQRAWVFFWGPPAHPQREALLNISQEARTGLSVLKGWERFFFQEGATSADLKEIHGTSRYRLMWVRPPSPSPFSLAFASHTTTLSIRRCESSSSSLAMKNETDSCWKESRKVIAPDTGKSLEVQLVLSLVIGVSAFLVFCILRPRWPALYAARKRRLDHHLGLPALPNSMFGWIPALFKITEEQVLASAGLDAFVFLSFFKMAIRLFSIMAIFATVVLLPINSAFPHAEDDKGNGGDDTSTVPNSLYGTDQTVFSDASFLDILKHKDKTDKSFERSWLWAYVVFTYFFVGLTIYYLNLETFRVIKFRQDYLGSQSTVTDRTFRLTGIPEDLRTEESIKELIEKLGIGKVEKVLLCRDWKKLDDLVDSRDATLRRLEAAWATFLKHQRQKQKSNRPQRRDGNGVPRDQEDDDQAGENGRLLDSQQEPWGSDDEGRPKVNIRYGTLGLRSRNVDAIDYYEERLRRLDSQVTEARKKSYAPTDMAIVTMDSVASCQMAIQARIDPRPGRLLTKLTPAPSDLVWRNTYAPRGIRRLKSWAVTLFITALTLAFIFPTIGISSLLSYCTIRTHFPAFAEWLQQHGVIFSLVQNGLPALVVSLLNVAVPYLYDFLSNHQGMISQGDVELSVISKNYFFTFFNTFFVFAVSLTGINFWSRIQEIAKDTSKMPRAIAEDVEELSIFYICFIMLQGIGLMPFRILEAGSVFLYPFLHWLSKTPRDALELKKPPVFQYGFFLPTSLLVFNLCLIYSVLAWGYVILIVGTVYFCLGYVAFKYMVLYAMDQPQHATGGAWRIISYRIIIGLLVLEVVMVGRIATSKAFIQSVCILPLLPLTIWYSYYIKQRFEPLTKYIALRAVRADEDPDDAAALDDAFENEDRPRPSQAILRRGSTLDEYKEKGLQFVNPSLVAPLPQPWIYDEPPPPIPTDDTQTTEDTERPVLQGVDSTLGIGDENVWRDNGGNNV